MYMKNGAPRRSIKGSRKSSFKAKPGTRMGVGRRMDVGGWIWDVGMDERGALEFRIRSPRATVLTVITLHIS